MIEITSVLAFIILMSVLMAKPVDRMAKRQVQVWKQLWPLLSDYMKSLFHDDITEEWAKVSERNGIKLESILEPALCLLLSVEFMLPDPEGLDENNEEDVQAIRDVVNILDMPWFAHLLLIIGVVNKYDGLKLARLANRLDHRLVPRFETPFQIILASCGVSGRPQLTSHWRDESSFPPWTTEPKHPDTNITMKDVVWVNASEKCERMSVRVVFEKLAELGCPVNGAVRFIIPHTVDDRGEDSDVCSDHWGILGQDMIHVDVSEEALVDLAQKIHKLEAAVDGDFSGTDQYLALHGEEQRAYLVTDLVQVRLIDADLMV